MNNKRLQETSLLLLVLLIAFKEGHSQQTLEHVAQTFPGNFKAQRHSVDVERSQIYWRGTKMRGLGKHEGIVQFLSGSFMSEEGCLNSGKFVVDMTSIKVTDMQAHEVEAQNNLNNHLKSPDFFHVDQFPIAEFEISQVICSAGKIFEVTGDLTIKEIKRPIEFEASQTAEGLEAKFTIDRFDWEVAYRGDWIRNTLVDPEVEIRVLLVWDD